MKPYIVCHVVSSADGRTVPHNWGATDSAVLFDTTAAKIKADAWLVGRTTMQHFSRRTPPKGVKRVGRIPKTDFVAPTRCRTFAVVIDPAGRCYWDSGTLDTEHVIEVLSERVSAAYLAHLRAANVSYVFGGPRTLNLSRVVDKLNSLFGIRRLRIDGGGTVNGSFLAAGLIDELSLVLAPIADGTVGSPTAFDVRGSFPMRRASHMTLHSARRLQNGVMWLRYRFPRPASSK
jgi:2,5-diamino-6-(ribosylamino)-4(3H)-pyrimidinone 5'-phosphate reductase